MQGYRFDKDDIIGLQFSFATKSGNHKWLIFNSTLNSKQFSLRKLCCSNNECLACSFLNSFSDVFFGSYLKVFFYITSFTLLNMRSSTSGILGKKSPSPYMSGAKGKGHIQMLGPSTCFKLFSQNMSYSLGGSSSPPLLVLVQQGYLICLFLSISRVVMLL